VKIHNCGFEALDVAESTQTYIENEGRGTIVTGCHFNFNDGYTFTTTGGTNSRGDYSIISSCVWDGDNTNGQIKIDADNCTVSNCVFRTGVSCTAHRIEITANGSYCSLNNLQLGSGGNIETKAIHTKMSDIQITQASSTTCTEGYCIVVDHASAGYATLNNISIYTDEDDLGGIKLSCTNNVVNNVSIRQIGATAGNTAHGILVDSDGTNNYISNVTFDDIKGGATTLVLSVDAAATGVRVVNVEGYLEASETWDPGNVADGEMVSNNVTVAGAVLGDIALASFSLDVEDLVLDAQVTAANTVTVTLTNDGIDAGVNLGEGTLRVSVMKRV
jgi:hypothetical protein